mgnify:CR=1 FL=1
MAFAIQFVVGGIALFTAWGNRALSAAAGQSDVAAGVVGDHAINDTAVASNELCAGAVRGDGSMAVISDDGLSTDSLHDISAGGTVNGDGDGSSGSGDGGG